MAGSNPEPAPSAEPMAEPAPIDDMGGDMGGDMNDKPFDDEPFDAGVEADEESDPKKFIEQLTGKLGQSLRKYTEQQGQPDFDLEKFAINSLLSATHTSEMDAEDQKDIISKVKTSGQGDEDVAPESDMDIPSDEDMPSDEEMPMDEPAGEEGLEELVLKEIINSDKLSTLKSKNIFSRNELKMILDMIYNSVDISGQYRIGDVYQSLGFPWGESTVFENMDNLFVNPKKNNMFQPGSNDKLNEACWKGYKQVGMKDKGGKQVPNCVPINEEEGMHAGESNEKMIKMAHDAITRIKGKDYAPSAHEIQKWIDNRLKSVNENLSNTKKSSIFDKTYFKGKLHETFNQDDTMNQPMTEPAPVVTPTKPLENPVIQPSRKNKPFLPMPEVTPDPKAKNDE